MFPSTNRPTALPKGCLSHLWIGALLAAALFVATPLLVHAGDGDLDPTFGDGGKVITDFGRGDAHANAIAVQADGKIVAAGRAYRPSFGQDIALARYNLNGTLDNTFGVSGMLVTDFFGYRDEATALAVQADGKLVVVGSAYKDNYYLCALARYNADGSLDMSFDTDGKVVLDIADTDGGEGGCNALVAQQEGILLVAGWTKGSESQTLDFVLVRLNSDGSVDHTFGIDGRVVTDFSGNDDTVYALALQSDGKIIAVGGSYDAATELSYIAVTRYNPDGSLDFTFGSGGKTITNLSGDVDASGTGTAVTTQPDSKIIVGGRNGGLGYNHVSALVRYTSAGALDPTFGVDGIVSPASARALVLQPDGKIIGAISWKLHRYMPNGAFDPTFDTSDTDFWLDEVDAIAMQFDGKIVTAGGHGVFALTRHKNFVPVGDPISLPLVDR